MAKETGQLVGDVVFESVTWTAAPIADGIIRDVLLCGRESKNKRKYTEKGMGGSEGVKKLYENLPVFLDHALAKPGDQPPARSTKDIAGVIRNPHWTESGVRGDIQTAGPYGPALLEIANAGIRGIGMSHTVMGSINKQTSEVTVSEAQSVDVVVNPATTKSFMEKVMPPDGQLEALASELTAIRTERDALKTEVSALNQKLTETTATLATASAKVGTLLTETTTLTSDLKAASDKLNVLETVAKAAEHRKLVESEIVTAGLDPANTAHVSENLLTILLDLPEPQRKTFLAERAGLLKAAPAAFKRDEPSKKSGSEFNAAEYNKRFA